MPTERDHRLAEAIEREYPRLRHFIWKQVTDVGDAEDILQDIFYELVEAYHLMKPVEQVGAWLFQVARNRITDLFRTRQRAAARTAPLTIAEHGEEGSVAELLPSPEAGPEAAYARGVLVDELAAALDELPAEQRAVFIAHELEGRSFKELAAETGLSVNTLLARKHYAVLYLRQRLQEIYAEFTKD